MNILNVKIHEQQKEWAIKAAAGIVTLFFCYMVTVSPVLRQIALLHQSIRDSQKRTELYREIQALKESLDSNESVLATLTERSQLLGKISDIAGQTQLHVETLTPRTEPNGGYIKLRMEMEGQGNFFSLLQFLQAVEKIGGAIKIRDVSALGKSFSSSQERGFSPNPQGQEGEHSLQIQLVFETLLKQRVKKNNV